LLGRASQNQVVLRQPGRSSHTESSIMDIEPIEIHRKR